MGFEIQISFDFIGFSFLMAFAVGMVGGWKRDGRGLLGKISESLDGFDTMSFCCILCFQFRNNGK